MFNLSIFLQGHSNQLTMIKPIVYHNFEEKELLEKKLMAIIPKAKRLSASEALMNIFYTSKKKRKVLPNQNRNDKSGDLEKMTCFTGAIESSLKVSHESIVSKTNIVA